MKTFWSGFRISVFILAVVLSGLLPGCFTPSKQAAKSERSVAAAKAAVQVAEDTAAASAKEYVAGTGAALDRAEPSPAVKTAQAFNDRAQAVLGAPDIAQLREVRSIVEGLLSDNAQARQSAQALLDRRDATVAGLQAKIAGLEHKVDAAETRRSGYLFDFASMADKWSTLTRFFWGLVAFAALCILGPLALRLAGVFFAPLGPVGGVFSAVVGKIGSAVLKSAPGAAAHAGVVARDSYDGMQATVERLVGVLQKAKESPEAAAIIRPILKQTTDPVSDPIIAGVKADKTL